MKIIGSRHKLFCLQCKVYLCTNSVDADLQACWHAHHSLSLAEYKQFVSSKQVLLAERRREKKEVKSNKSSYPSKVVETTTSTSPSVAINNMSPEDYVRDLIIFNNYYS